MIGATDEWIHLTVDGEEIICTPNHPFYSPVKGWTNACHLRAGDILVTVNGEYVVVEKIEHELLENPETTYNFEVKDFHTYYVGSAEVLVHNECEKVSNGKYRAFVNDGETERPHAHIYEKSTSVGRIFRDGTMDASLKNNRTATKFVRNNFDDIMRLIDEQYEKPRH